MIINEPISMALVYFALFIGLVTAISLWVVYYLDPKRPRSWLLLAIAQLKTALWLCALYLGWIAKIRVEEGLSGVPPWTSPVTTLVVVIVALAGSTLITQFWRHRND